MEPTIALARNGFNVTAKLGMYQIIPLLVPIAIHNSYITLVQISAYQMITKSKFLSSAVVNFTAQDIQDHLADASEELRTIFSDDNGQLYQEGDIVTMSGLSSLIEHIAADGQDAFYTGNTVQNIRDQVNRI